MDDRPDDDLVLAATLVREAGALAARMRDEGLTQQTKTSVSDIVTDADRAAERLIAERLHAERPADGIVGEEGTSSPGERTWYLDPVDGTYNFAAGLPTWCSAVALTDRADTNGAATVLAGAVHAPTLGELWTGGAGQLLCRNGEPVAPLEDRGLAESSVCTYLHPGAMTDPTLREPVLRALSGAATVRMLGSGSVELAYVAAGRIGGFVHNDSPPWDWYPGAALVRAAGGAAEVIEHDGHHWYLAGPSRVVAELADRLRR